MDAAALTRAILAQRESWFTLDETKGLKVLLRRPAEDEMPEVWRMPTTKAAARCVIGWEGFTEATFLGAAVGSSDPQPFSAEVWAVVIADKVGWAKRIDAEISKLIKAHKFSTEEQEKNFSTTSTPGPASS